jgi:hypothetical protein
VIIFLQIGEISPNLITNVNIFFKKRKSSYAYFVAPNLRLSDATPVGGKPCAWGPAFWCQSPIHAQACGTFDHCRKMGISFDD